jgi:hypothetical protein
MAPRRPVPVTRGADDIGSHGAATTLVTSNREIRELPGRPPRHEGLEFFARIAWRWEQRRQACDRPEASRASHRATLIAAPGAR